MLEIDRAIIFDANILIDFHTISKEIFQYINELSIDMFVSDVTLTKVEQIGIQEANNLNIKILETPISMLIESRNRKVLSLSFDDYVSFLQTKENDLILITNDKAMKNYAERKNIKALWEIEIILFLLRKDKLSKIQAKRLFYKIKDINNRITDRIEENFIKLLNE